MLINILKYGMLAIMLFIAYELKINGLISMDTFFISILLTMLIGKE